MIHRDLAPKLVQAATQAPAVTLTGPRQSGKTTLSRAVFPRHPYVSLEAPDERAFATEDPRGFLARFPDGAILDEIQRAPSLLSYLQGLIDDDPTHGQWILTGSQNLSLLQAVSQSLAGRTQLHHLLPLAYGEVTRFDEHPKGLEEALLAGGYPRIFDRKLNPSDWLRSYVATYLERDVRSIANVGNLATFQRFVELCAGRTAQLLNYSALAADCGVSQPTAKAWLGILEASFVVFRLPAYSANIRKRLVKMPKMHFFDTGLVCWLLGIRHANQLRTHPLRGPIFETWVATEILKHRINRGETRALRHYRDRNTVEVDLVIDDPRRIALVEAKSSKTASSSLLAGAKRIQRHFNHRSEPLEAAVAYGGDEFQQRLRGQLIPWRALRATSLGRTCQSVSVFTGNRPAAGVEVLALFPNKTWKRAVTDEHGEASLALHSSYVGMTVFAAAEGLSAHVERDWVPAERALHIELRTIQDGGSAVFPNGHGRIPSLSGRLNPVRDTLDRTYLYASSIAINGGVQQPAALQAKEPLRLTDADGTELTVRVIEILGSSCLVEYGPR